VEKGYHLSGVMGTMRGREKGDELMWENSFTKLMVVKANIIYDVITVKDITQHGNKYVNRAIRDILRWTGPLLARAIMDAYILVCSIVGSHNCRFLSLRKSKKVDPFY
jgi:hypothetical protein